MATYPNEIYPAADLPLATPGASDSLIYVDEAGRLLRRSALANLPVTAPQQAALAAMQAVVDAAVAGQTQGYPGYPLASDLPSPPAAGVTLSLVTNDPDPEKNGTWRWTGSAWVKSVDRSDSLVEGVRADAAIGSRRNLLSDYELDFSDLGLINRTVGMTLSRVLQADGSYALRSVPDSGDVNRVRLPWFPVSLFPSGKVSLAVEILSAPAVSGNTPTNQSVRLIQASDTSLGTAVQSDFVVITPNAITESTWYRIDNISISPSAKSIVVYIRRDKGEMVIGRIVLTQTADSTERPTSADRTLAEALAARGYAPASSSLANATRLYLNAGSVAGTDSGSPTLYADGTGISIGSIAGQTTISAVRADVSLESGEAEVTGTIMSSLSMRVVLGIGPSEVAASTRRWYMYRQDGALLSCNEDQTDETVIAPAGTCPPYVQGDVVKMKLTRNADGTGRLTGTGNSGAFGYVDLPSVLPGWIWMGVRHGAASQAAGVRVTFTAVEIVGANAAVAELSERVDELASKVEVTAPVLEGWSVLPSPTLGRVPIGFTCTGLSLITRGTYAGCWAIGDDGRLVAGDSSPFVPRVHILDRDARNILATINPGYSGASLQGTATQTSETYDRLWIATSDDGRLLKFAFDGTAVTADTFDWVAAGYDGKPNALAYDPSNNALWVAPSEGKIARLISCDGTLSNRLLDTRTLGVSGSGTAGSPDHFCYLASRRILLYSIGANGVNGQVRAFYLDTNQDVLWGVLPGALAIEGIYCDESTGMIYTVCDTGYHAPGLNQFMRYRMPPLP